MSPSRDPFSRQPNRPFPTPVKHLRYHGGFTGRRMTVCIAAICHNGGYPKIVICADTRFASAFVGSTDSAFKIKPLPYGWLLLLATDDWNSALTLYSHLSKIWGTLKDSSPAVICHKLEKQFSRHQFCSKATDALICGFTKGHDPVVLYLGVSPEESPAIVLSAVPEFETIGCGSVIARVFLMQRDCGAIKSLDYILYSVYEAKKASEKEGNVGPKTHLAIIGPPSPKSPHSCSLIPIREDGIKLLERWRRKKWLRSVSDVLPDVSTYIDKSEADVTREFQLGFLSSTDDLSTLQPLQEPPGESDES